MCRIIVCGKLGLINISVNIFVKRSIICSRAINLEVWGIFIKLLCIGFSERNGTYVEKENKI